MPAAPISIAQTLAYWLNSIYHLKPPTAGMARRITFAMITTNMTAIITAATPVVMLSIQVWIFFSIVSLQSDRQLLFYMQKEGPLHGKGPSPCLVPVKDDH